MGATSVMQAVGYACMRPIKNGREICFEAVYQDSRRMTYCLHDCGAEEDIDLVVHFDISDLVDGPTVIDAYWADFGAQRLSGDCRPIGDWLIAFDKAWDDAAKRADEADYAAFMEG